RLLTDVKTLVSIGEADVRLVTLLDVTVVQGEPSQIDVRIPSGYEVSSVSGASLDRTEMQGDRIALFVSNAAQRRHQFLISLERQSAAGSFKMETGFPAVPSAQRETGEAAVEGVGTLEVTSPPEPAGLRRIDAVGGSGGRACEAGRRARRHARAAAAAGVSSRRAVCGDLRVPARRDALRQEGRHADDATENGPAGQRRRVGAVRAGPVPR